MITYQSLAAEAEARWHPDHTHLLKAVEIASGRNNIYNLRCPEGEYDVRSQVSLNGWYHVDTKRHTCTCKDSQQGHVCKHRLAVWLYVEEQTRTMAEIKRSAAASQTPTHEEIERVNQAYYAKMHAKTLLAELGY